MALSISANFLLASVTGTGWLGIEVDIEEKIKSFQCKFYGDVLLPKNPTNFEEAMKVYSELPGILAETPPVPLVVYLAPLGMLDSNAAKLTRQLSSNLVQEVAEVDLYTCNRFLLSQFIASVFCFHGITSSSFSFTYFEIKT